MSEPALPYDYARCAGRPGADECKQCLRRIAPPNPVRQSYMAYWEREGACPYRIGAKDRASNA